MLSFIKKYWKVLLAALGAVFAFIAGILISEQFGRKPNILQGGNGLDSAGNEKSANISGQLESNQSAASRQNSELGNRIGNSQDVAKSIDADNKSAKNTIDDAQQQLDKLKSDLGIN